VALDFTLPPDLKDLLDRVHAYVVEDVLPAEGDVADPTDLLTSWHVVERLRDRARERGIYTPHLPEEWGGLGVGTLGMALISQEVGVSGLASLGLNAMAPATPRPAKPSRADLDRKDLGVRTIGSFAGVSTGSSRSEERGSRTSRPSW